MPNNLRMFDMNRVTIAGYLTRDPELKHVGTAGTAMCKLGLACNRRYKMKDGEQREEILFVNVVIWGKAAKYVAENLQKGRPVLVEGRLKSSEWEAKETGEKRSAIEINADRVQSLDWEGEKVPDAEINKYGEEVPF